MPNNSATGGFLQQTSASIEGDALKHFIQELIVGVTGIVNTLVRPLWQANPPNMPSIETDWCAFGIQNQIPDANSYHKQLANGGAQLLRHEELEIYCVFYGNNAKINANKLRDGLEIGQNREILLLNGIGLKGFSNTKTFPELINNRYFERSDITMSLRREIRRDYQILHFLAADGTVYADDAASQPLIETWSVSN